MLRRICFIAIALVFVVIGAYALNLRALYAEMYPAEPVKRTAFHICNESDPTFVRAIGSEREACYASMPNIMEVAMGRVRPGGALSMQALTDPSREAELLMMLASMPPRQPITTRRSFSNTAWVPALSSPCDDKHAVPAVSYTAPGVIPPPVTNGRAATVNGAIRKNLPLPGTPQGGAGPAVRAPVIVLGPAAPLLPSASGDPADKTAAANPAPAPDVGDVGPPAIVPLAPATSCGGA